MLPLLNCSTTKVIAIQFIDNIIIVKDIAKYWKFSGKNSKEYDNSVNNYIHSLNVGGISKMQLPSNDKDNLNLIQSYIVFQLYVFSLKSFTIEISVSDSSNIKRRLLFSACSKEIIINALHCRIPLVNFPINNWVNASIDVLSFVSECFKGQSFKSIDYICLSANCKVRKIYGMRNNLTELLDNGLNNGDFSLIPKGIVLPKGVEYINFNLNINIMKGSERKDKVITPMTNAKNNLISTANTENQKDKIGDIDLFHNQNQSSNKTRAKSQAKPLKKHNTKVITQFSLKNELNNNEQDANDLNNQPKGGGKKQQQQPMTKKWNLYDQNGRKTKNALLNEPRGEAPELLIPCINGVTMDIFSGICLSNKAKTMKQCNIPKRHITSTQQTTKHKQQEDINEDLSQESKQPLFNTFNYRNIDSYHWDAINRDKDKDSIQEIVDFDTHNNTILTKKDEIIYYDNPHLKEKKITPSDVLTNNIKQEETEKMYMMDQLLQDKVVLPNNDAHRPYTPPLSKLVPLEADDPVNLTKINESIIHKHYPEMVYDEVKGCYFNTNTKVYYDFKEGF